MLQRIRTTRFMLPVLLAITALLVIVPFSGIASAHDQLIDSNPSEGQDFAEAPTAASLRFSAEMIEIGAEIALLEVDSEDRIELPEALTIDYDTVTQPLPELGQGSYSLNWRVVSQDGHPISGTIAFTVAGGSATSGENPAGSTEQDSDQPSGNSSSALLSEPWMIVALSVVGVLVAAGAIVTFVMRMRRGNTPGN